MSSQTKLVLMDKNDAHFANMSRSVQPHSSAVYQVSIDTRSKRPEDPLWRFEIKLENQLQFVRSVQLGSITTPTPLDAVRCDSKITYSEPIDIPCEASICFRSITTKRQDSTKYNPLSGAVTTTKDVSACILIPPTMNAVASAVAAGTTFTTAEPHGLYAALTYYPCQLPINIVGGAYPADASVNYGTAAGPYGPIINSSTVSTASITNSTTFAFNAGVLNALVPAASANTHTARNLGGTDLSYNSFIFSERPTISELLMILNNAIVGECTTFANKPVFRLDDPNAQLTLGCPTLVEKYDGYIFETKVYVTGNALATLLGITGSMTILDPPVRVDLIELGFVRRVPIHRGSYTASELAIEASRMMNGLTVEPASTDASYAQFFLRGSGGEQHTIVIPEGRYTGPQLAGLLQSKINYRMSLDASSVGHYAVTFALNPALDGGMGGRFTISNDQSLRFSMQFLDVRLGSTLGDFDLGAEPQSDSRYIPPPPFQPGDAYWGADRYVSPELASRGISPNGSYPRNQYYVAVNSVGSKFTFYSGMPETAVITNKVSGSLDASFQWLTTDLSGRELVVGGLSPTGTSDCPIYEVMGVYDSSQNNYWSALVKNIYGTGYRTYDVSANLTLYPTPSLLYADASMTAVPRGAHTMRSLRRNAFQMHWCDDQTQSDVFGYPPQTVPIRTALNQAATFGTEAGKNCVAWSNQQDKICVNPGAISYAAPACTPVTVPVTPFIYPAPFSYELGGPAYMLMRLLKPTGSTEHNIHSIKDTRYSILAKVYFPITLHRQTYISEDLVHSTFVGRESVDRVLLEFLDPAGRPMDFNGRNFSFSLLFVLEQGYAHEVCY